MKHSIQSKFLITIISAMLAITVFISSICLFEVDKFTQQQTEAYIHASCENEALSINNSFDNMERSVTMMVSYVLGFFENDSDITNPDVHNQIIKRAEDMFADVANQATDTVAYYLRFSPTISNSRSGLFYSKIDGKGDFVPFDLTDIYQYDRDDTSHVGWYWQPYYAGKPIWMLPYYNENIDMLIISYVVPMYYRNQFIGVVGMDFDFTVLTDKINKIKIFDNDYAYLENNKKIVYHNGLESGDAIPDVSDKYMQISEHLNNDMELVVSVSYDDINQIKHNISYKIFYAVIFLAALFSIVVYLVVRRIVNPLKKLTEAATKLSCGDYNVKIEHSNTREIKLLSTAFENMTMHLREHERLQYHLAYRDPLTGLRNTTSYKAWVTDFDNKNTEMQNIRLGVVVLDINNLKKTNDKYGHDVGNKLIITAAQIISGIFKRSPVFRIGGDEFLIILQDRDLDDYKLLLNKFDKECMNGAISVNGDSIGITIARGVAMYNSLTDEKFVDVFNRADDAMYENKRKIKNQEEEL